MTVKNPEFNYKDKTQTDRKDGIICCWWLRELLVVHQSHISLYIHMCSLRLEREKERYRFENTPPVFFNQNEQHNRVHSLPDLSVWSIAVVLSVCGFLLVARPLIANGFKNIKTS